MSKLTLNQKIAIAMLIVAIAALFVKQEITINYMQGELNDIKIKYAEIDELKSNVSTINTVITNEIKNACRNGTKSTVTISDSGLTITCI